MMTGLYTAEQTRALDRISIDEAGLAGYTLMTRAGAAAFGHLRSRWPEAHRMHVVCGTGNNGGDGWVIARLARMAGLEVMVDLVGPESRIHGDARQAMYDYLQAGGEFRALDDGTPCDPDQADIIVDAVAGTGFIGALRPEYQRVIERINDCDAPVLAIDCPSGLNPDTGHVATVAVRAEVTVTFIGCKRGLLTGDAPDYCGELIFDDLGIPPWVYDKVAPSAHALNSNTALSQLATPPATAHKGHFGHLLVIAGNRGMGGAGLLAAEAALRSGAGLVTLATHPEHVGAALARRPEIMARGVNSSKELKPLIDSATAIVIGPGLGQDRWSQDVLSRAMEAHQPLLLDADALNLLVGTEASLGAKGPRVITPHPGEAARLLGTDTRSIHQDRFAAARRLAETWQAVTVLKGAGTVIADPEQAPESVCPYGNPGMATAGMGDALSGIIGALLAQGLSARGAADIGVTVHACAGDRAAQTCGQRSLLAGDLIAALAEVYRS